MFLTFQERANYVCNNWLDTPLNSNQLLNIEVNEKNIANNAVTVFHINLIYIAK